MKTTVKYGIDFPIWNGHGGRLIGVATWRLKKNNLNLFCNYRRKKDGKRLWEGNLYITEKFASKFPIKEYKGKNGKFTVYQIPLQDLQEYNNQIWDKYYQKKNANLTSPIYSQEQISDILKKNPIIRDIGEHFGGGELTPNL